jgi:aminopeptidase N
MPLRQFFTGILAGSLSLISGLAQAQMPGYGGKLKPEQANMDILHYTISLTVNIPDKTIGGYTTIDLLLKQPATVLLFDLMDSLTVEKVWVNGKTAAFTHSHHLLRLEGPTPWNAGKVSVKVQYGGKPMTARNPPWDDGFTFTKDSTGTDWVAITAEGTGGKLYFPCKDHPSDEPDQGVDLIVTVPRGLLVAGPGLLKETIHKGSLSTFHWKTIYPINNYSIVFNIGNYEVVRREYTTINGNKVPMEFYVLKAHAAQAPHLLEIMERSAHVKEKYFGEYPWVKEKIGLVETPHLGMEHQTMNAYGNRFRYGKIGGMDFDWLMNHEFGHEWWGNKVTAGDWADYWIHEGIGSFGDDLYTRDVEGEDAYEKLFQKSLAGIRNDKPIVMGKDIEEEEAYHGDIYGKGAFFMHTLRYVTGDSIFFPTLRRLATDSSYTYTHTVNTDDVQKLFSSASGTDLSPLFDLYLRTIRKLEIQVKQTDVAKYQVQLTNIDMPLPMDLTTDSGTTRIILSKKPVVVVSKTLPVLDSRVFYLKKVVYE